MTSNINKGRQPRTRGHRLDSKYNGKNSKSTSREHVSSSQDAEVSTSSKQEGLKLTSCKTFRSKYERKHMLSSDLAGTDASRAQIWQCYEKNTQKEVSVKWISKEKTSLEQFQQEVAVMEEGNGHPNLMTVREIYECPEYYYIVTENINHPTIIECFLDNHKDGASPMGVGCFLKVLVNVLVHLHDPNHPSKRCKKAIAHGNINAKTVLVPKRDGAANINHLLLADFSQARFLSAEDGQTFPKNVIGNKKNYKKHKPTRFQPPEYDPRVEPTTQGDIWALGVLVFLLLTGKYPFARPSEAKMGVPNWYKIKSPDLRDLIQSMLEYDPDNRPTSTKLNDRNNAWQKHLNSCASDSPELEALDLQEALRSLTQMNKEYQFKRAVRSYIATNLLQDHQQERLQNVFQWMDIHNDNALSRTEFQRAALQAGILDEDDNALVTIDKVFEQLADKNTRKISYTDFMAFATRETILLETSKLKAVFEAMDGAQKGYVTAQDLTKFFGGSSAAFEGEEETILSSETIHQWMQEAGKREDGKISFEEFANMMVKKPYFTVFTW